MTTLTWKTQPSTGEWNTADNWTPSGVSTEKAAFSTTSQTAITFSATGDATVDCIEFAYNAPTYTFILGPSTATALTITGFGIINRSRKQQSLIVAANSSGHETPQLKFINSATAGGDDMFYCAGPATVNDYGGGVISFCNQSIAGSASFKVWTGAAAPPKHSTVGGEVSFSDSASADAARFTIYGTLGTDGDTFGNVVFHDAATAANATFTNVGGTVSGGDGGNTQFYVTSTAANGVFYNLGGTNGGYGGRIVFYDVSSGGTAKVQLFGNGELDISDHTKGVTIAALDLNGGIIGIQIGTTVTRLTVKGVLSIKSTHANFSFRKNDKGGFAFNTPYTILTNVNLASFTPDQFNGNSIEGVEPSFTIVGNDLQVTFFK